MNYLIQNKHWNIVEDYNLDKLLYLLIDRPIKAINNTFIWKNNKKQFHRNYDLPSYVFSEKKYTHLWWYFNDLKHRINNKPSYIDFNGIKEYWRRGKYITFNPKQNIFIILFDLIDRPDKINSYNDINWINFSIEHKGK